jgi:hypothetical protein
MKRLMTGVLFVFLAACASNPKKTEPDKNQEYITHQNRMMVDMCDQENMPRFPRRPQIDRQKLKSLNVDNGEMDAYVQDFIDRQNKYIDTLVNVIAKTRQRVDQCR